MGEVSSSVRSDGTGKLRSGVQRSRRVSRPGVAASDPVAAFRVQALPEAFSGVRLARLIGVNASQPSRWASGKEKPGPRAATALIDLDHVYARARLVWGPKAAASWIESPNSFLEGATPIEVLHRDGPARVLDALDAETWGASA